MAPSSVFVLRTALVAVLVFAPCADAKGFLVDKKRSLRSTVDSNAFQAEVRNAMGEAMGCGGHVGKEKLAELEKDLKVIWHVMPKNSKGRIERRSLRHIVFRYFNQKSALMVRGYEPSRPTNTSNWGTDDILSQRVPAYVESVLESKHVHENGFSLEDAALMVATVEQLIFDSEATILEKVYGVQHKPTDRSLTALGLGQVLEEYMVHWMLGEDEESIRLVANNRGLLEESVPHWDQVVSFVHGQIKTLDFQRQHAPAKASRPGHNALAPRYSFEDAHHLVGGITSLFSSFWDSECASMKASLVGMDSHHTGRVRLSQFYGTGLDKDWRFGESESYLRELGALDETSAWFGKQVIIPNYLQAASNCIVSTPHYLVCCRNECEALLGEIEASVGGEMAGPAQILSLLQNMTSQTDIDHDAPPYLGLSLRKQLEEIAEENGGQVPLHGRLFAQWLHYVFPRECPFPHKRGTAVSLTPSEYGEDFIASQDDMKQHAASAEESDELAPIDKDDLQWMSQWSPEEELVADPTGSIRASWNPRRFALGLLLLLAFGVVGAVGFGRKMMITSDAALLPTHTKSHFV